jgi:hypothetical protein
MLLLKVKSRITGETLAQLRSSKDKVQVIADRSNGAITSLFEQGMDVGKQKLDRSSTLMLEKDDTNVLVHKYLLTNGDIVQITSDGITVILNGVILDEDYKQKLLQALAEKQLTVAQKSPGVGPEAFYQPKPVDMMAKERKKILQQKWDHAEATRKKEPVRNRHRDHLLDELIKDHPKTRRPFFKKLAYLLSYGDKK